MTLTPTLRSRPVPTLTLCAICGGPVPIAAGRDLCLGCLGGDERPAAEAPRVAGSAIRHRRRVERRVLAQVTWRLLDAVAGGLSTPEQLSLALGLTPGQVAVRAGQVAGRRPLLVATADGYALTADGTTAVLTRTPPPITRLIRERLASGRERQARYRARIRALRGES